MTEITSRCTGSYTNLNGEFGRVINQECIGCQRRAPGDPDRPSYTQPPQFEGECKFKLREDV